MALMAGGGGEDGSCRARFLLDGIGGIGREEGTSGSLDHL